MRNSVFLIPVVLLLVLAGAFSAGCMGDQASSSTATPSAVTTTVSAATTSAQQVSFTLGDHYLQKSYSFQSESQVVTEQFRVDNPAWGIEFDVLPLNDDKQYCWFEMTVTNIDTGQSQTYGYGRSNGYELKNQIPMYTTGPYKLVMKGNRVKVDVTAAKRNP